MKSIWVFLLFLVDLVVLISIIEGVSIQRCSKRDNKPMILDTTSGRLLGSCEFVNVNDNNPRAKSGNIYSWLGVPYAEPPVNEYRFKRPLEVQKRSEPIDATKWPNACMQSSSSGLNKRLFTGYQMWQIATDVTPFSEDCLYLNIWLPAEAYLKVNIYSQSNTLEPPKLPILVFFHGGGSTEGSTSMDVYNPVTFAAATNTIVISIQYRLGIFGNLYLENEFPGNQALLDQNEALRWIRNNAEAMGGDVNRITIGGFSAGAAMVGYHLLIRESWPFFTNAILQSGTPLIKPLEAISKEEANKRTKELLSLTGCVNETASDSDIAQCAQMTSNLDRALNDLEKRLTNDNLFTKLNIFTLFPPVIDNEVLTASPEELFNRGEFKKCPILTGYLIDEGSIFSGYSTGDLTEQSIKQRPAMSHKDLKQNVKSYFKYYPEYPTLRNDLIVDAILHEYTKITESDTEIQSALLKPNYFHVLSKIIGEYLFVCPAYKFVDILSKHSVDVYLYLFAHRVSSTPWPSWYGATHGDELAFTLAHTLAEREESSIVGVNPWSNPRHRYSSGEKLLTNEMISYWSNFIRNNSPNSKNFIHWPKYTLFNEDFDSHNMTDVNESVRYIIFKSTGIRINRGYSLEVCQFWNSYLDKLLKENEKQINSVKQSSTSCDTAHAKQLVEMKPSALREKTSGVYDATNKSTKLDFSKFFMFSISLFIIFF